MKIICVTPIKNEEWILDKFLQATSLWADYIILADQQSTDRSREIASEYAKVILIDNNTNAYNEHERFQLLIKEARKIDGNRLLIALDADEILTPDFASKDSWRKMLDASPGTVIKFQWANIYPGYKKYWNHGFNFPWGFMDDGSPYKGLKMHSPRLPLPLNAPEVNLDDIKVMHLQYLDWGRYKSKHRWYMLYEFINHPEKDLLDIYRLYNMFNSTKGKDIKPVPVNWISDYEKMGINIVDFAKSEFYYWDLELLSKMSELGPSNLSKLVIWDKDWVELARSQQMSDPKQYKDPRSLFEKLVHLWLRKSQSYYPNFICKVTDKFIRLIWSSNSAN